MARSTRRNKSRRREEEAERHAANFARKWRGPAAIFGGVASDEPVGDRLCRMYRLEGSIVKGGKNST